MSLRRLVIVAAVFLVALFGGRGIALADDHHDHDDHATAAAEHHDDAIDPELDVDMHDAPAATDHAKYGAFLRAALAKARPHVVAKLEAKATASQASSMDRLSLGLFLFSLLGILLAWRPLFLLPKYPGRGATLFKYGFLSSVLFFCTVNLFAMVIGLFRGAQGAVAHYTNPQIAIVEAAFDILDHRAEDLAVLGPRIIEPSLHKVAQGDASFVVVLLENLKGVKGDVDVILAIAKAMKSIDWLFAYIPVILTLVAVITFALSAKDTLLAIVRLPESAMEGGGAGVVVKSVLRRVKGELLATLGLIAALVVLSVLGGMALRAAVLPAVESFLGTVFLAAMYIQTEKVSSVVLFGSLGLAALVLVLNTAVVLVTTSSVLGKLHKILQRKFHDGVPLGAHAKFWKRAPIAIAIGFLFPVAYDFVSEKGVEAIMARTLESSDPSYATALVGSPAILVGGFLVLFAACYGVHSLLFVFRYPAKTVGSLPASASAPPPTFDLSVFDRLVVAVPLALPSESDLAKTSVFQRAAPDVTTQTAPLFPETARRVLDTSRRA